MHERSRRLLRVGGLTLLGLLILVFVYALRSVFYPVLVGFLLAYAFTPLVDWQVRIGMHRAVAVATIYMVGAIVALSAVLYGMPVVLSETGALVDAIIGDQYEDLNRNGKYDPPPPPEPEEKVEAPAKGEGAEPGPTKGEGADPLDYLAKGPKPVARKPAAQAALPPGGRKGDRLTRDINADGVYDPGYIERLRLWAKRFVDNWNARFDDRPDLQISLDNLTGRLEDSLRAGVRGVREAGETVYTAVRDNLLALLGLIGFLALTPIYAFFFMLEMHSIERAVVSNIPGRARERSVRVLHDIHEAISSFFRGRLLICLIDAVLTCIVLYFADTRFWLIFGLVTGVFGIVPIVGPTLAYVPIALLTLVDHGVMTMLWMSLGFWGVQSIDGWILTPLILGPKVRLHPVALIIAFLVGGRLFGAFGVLLAVPVASILKILGREFVIPSLKALAKENAPPAPEGEAAP